MRRAQLEKASTASPYRVSAQTVNLDPATAGFSKLLPVFNPSTAPAPMTITSKFPDASSSVQAMSYFLATTDKIAGNHYLSDYLNGPYYAQCEASGNGWTLAAGTDTTLAGTVDAAASPGSGTTAATITHVTNAGVYLKRITFTRTTLLDSLRGTHRVYARVKTAGAYSYNLQLAWSAGGQTREMNDEFLLDGTADSAAKWAMCDLGDIVIPDSTAVTLGSLSLELYTKCNAGTASLFPDYLAFVPVSNTAQVIAADASTSVLTTTNGGFMGAAVDLGAGDPTWSAGVALGQAMKLDSNNESAAIGGTAGGFAGVTSGKHGVTTLVYESGFIGTWKIECANLTDTDLLDSAGNSMSTSYVRTVASNGAVTHTRTVNEENADVYQPRVVITSYTSGALYVGSITTWPYNTINQNEQIRTDPGSTGLDRYAAERLDSSSQYTGSLSADRVPFWVPPGLSLLWVESFDLSVGGEELPHLNARTITVTPTVYPRYWG